MSEKKKDIKPSDVTGALATILEATGIYEVDQTPDHYVRRSSDGELIPIKENGVLRNLAVFGSQADDVIIVNPFKDGTTSSSPSVKFYRLLTISMSEHVGAILRLSFACAASENSDKAVEMAKPKKSSKVKKAVEDDVSVDETSTKVSEKGTQLVAGLLEGNIGSIDEKMCRELESILKWASADSGSLLSISYSRREHKASLNSRVFNDNAPESLSGVRKSTWTIIRNIILRLFDVKSLEDFDYVPKSTYCPIFESYANVFSRVMSCVRLFSEIHSHGIRIKAIKELPSHLKYLDEYYAIARFSNTTRNTDEKDNGTPAVQTTPVAPGNVTVGMPGVPTMPQMPMPVMGMPPANATPPNGLPALGPVNMTPMQFQQPAMNTMPMSGMPSMPGMPGMQPAFQQPQQMMQQPMMGMPGMMPQQQSWQQPMPSFMAPQPQVNNMALPNFGMTGPECAVNDNPFLKS